MFYIKNINKISSFKKTVPEAMAGFLPLDQAAMKDGAIPKKYKEPMALVWL